jgi:hypothetical protein
LAFAAAPAVAAAPEAPETKPVTAITATTATFHGFLNPNATAAGEAGQYEFLYKQSASECEGASKAPEPPGTALGFEHEEVPAQEVTGLTPHSEYTVCLVARNLIAEETVGSAVTFKTALPPEAPEAKPASEVTATTATLNGVLNPLNNGDAGTYEFLYKRSASECEGESAAPQPAGASAGSSPEPVSSPVSGLIPTATYTFCLRALNGAGEAVVGPPETFATPARAPTITGEAVSDVGSVSARLSAQITPEGSSTTYHFEYGTSATYGSATPSASVGSGTEGVNVIGELGELQPDTVYHFRVVATNAKGETDGPDATFTTFPVAPVGLPDGRGFEMVTPVESEDMNVYVLKAEEAMTFNELHNGAGTDFTTDKPMRAAPDGHAVTYRASPAAGGSPNYNFGDAYLAVRSASGGWTQTNLQPNGRLETEFYGFSPDLSVGVVDSNTRLSESVPASLEKYHVLYADHLGAGGLSPFFTVTPELSPFAFGGRTENHRLTYAGASGDLKHLMFEANGALTAKAKENPPTGSESMDLYDSVNGEVFLVNVLPGGAVNANASFGAQATSSSGSPNAVGAISSDGSRIYWTDEDTGTVYVRLNATQPPSPLGGKGECVVPADACTLAVSAGAASYWTTSVDARYAYYTEGGDLYRFDAQNADRAALTSGASVVGVAGVSADGEYVYFAARSTLTGANGEGKAPVVGAENLYVLHAGVLAFIGIGESKNVEPVIGARTAEVTADGGSLVFMSPESLTGYNNAGMDEVFAYDARSGRLACASCDPSGEPPIYTIPRLSFLAAAYLPFRPEPGRPGDGFRDGAYQGRWISADGSRVFFDSNEPLVPQDRNARQDVYEWERDGSGTCGRAGGCIYLLSGATSTGNSYLLDASATGDDVFIVTRAKLVPQDTNEYFHLYDVRVGAPQPLAQQACSGTGCQGVPGAPPLFATPSSVTFNGSGNFAASAAAPGAKPPAKPLTRAQKLARALRACSHQPRRRRATCRRRAHRRYGAAAVRFRRTNGRGK